MAWDDLEVPKGGGGEDWYNFKDDVLAVLRIAAKPVFFKEYFVQSDKRSYVFVEGDPKAEGQQLSSKYLTKALVWEVTKVDGKPSQNFIGAKMVKLPYTVIKQILDAAFDPDYDFDDIPERLISIRRTKNGQKTEYSVQQKDKFTISEDQKEALGNLPEPSDMLEKMKGNTPANEATAKEVFDSPPPGDEDAPGDPDDPNAIPFD